MTITTRAGKGSALTHEELDENLTDLRDGIGMMLPKDSGTGIKVDSLGTPTFGWADLIGAVTVADLTDPLAPSVAVYKSGIKQFLFAENDEAQLMFHLPHDYLLGSNIYIHVHWSHNGTLVTGGTATWGFELCYAKGHNQAPFGASITVVQIQNASTTQYQHMICEAIASTSGGSSSLLDLDLLEIDGLIFGRVFLDSNSLTVSGGSVPNLFLHTVDIHYQTTNIGTKNRSPSFYA